MSSQKLMIILENSQGPLLPQCSLERGTKQNDLSPPSRQRALGHKSETAFWSDQGVYFLRLTQGIGRGQEIGRGSPFFSFSKEVGSSSPATPHNAIGKGKKLLPTMKSSI